MKNKLWFLILLLIASVLLFSFVSCSKDGSVDGDQYDKETSDGISGGSQSSSSTVIEDRKIIKTVNETVETEKYDEFITKLQETVTAMGGYISSSVYTGSDNDNYGERTASFVIRIPAERLSEFTDSVGGLSTVVSFKETQDDITLDYVDVASRIEVLEAEYAALLDILSNATTTADMLAIRAQIEDVQKELASLKAQKQIYDSQIAYSTVNIEVFEVETEIPYDNSFFARVGRTFTACIKGLGAFFANIGVIILGGSPVIILIAVIFGGVLLVARLVNKRCAKAKNDRNDKNSP